RIAAELAPESTALGSVRGRLEHINLHKDANGFRIYPVVGPPSIECRFPQELQEDASRAIGRNVRVHGKLHYRARSNLPYRIAVSRIVTLPFDSELPSLMELRGMAPEATGEASSEDFVRSLRIARE